MKKNIFFTKKNYILILAGLAVSVIGYILMSGGGSEDPNVFNYEVFSGRRITLAPFLVMAGYAIVLVGIMKKFRPDEKINSDLDLTTKKKK